MTTEIRVSACVPADHEVEIVIQDERLCSVIKLSDGEVYSTYACDDRRISVREVKKDLETNHAEKD